MTAEPQIAMPSEDFRIAAIAFKEEGVITRARPIEQEREVAISDLLEKNYFRLSGSQGGPYYLILRVEENRLVLDVSLKDAVPRGNVMISHTPSGRVNKDYFLVGDTYYKAIRTAPPH